jgi:hypothetical protein
MKAKTKWILGGCVSALILFAVTAILLFWYVVPAILMTPRSYSPQQMWTITHEWTRTAPLPSDTHDVTIHSEGSDFTRQFRASLRFPNPVSLQAWIKASPGFSDAGVSFENDGTKVFQIKPGGGAMFAEIKIYSDNRVEINTYWS